MRTKKAMPAILTHDTVLIRDPELVSSMVDGLMVVMNVRSGTCFDFNRVGTEIWNLLAGPRQVEQILTALAQSYVVDRDDMAREVMAFLQRLLDRQLLRIVKAARPGAAPGPTA